MNKKVVTRFAPSPTGFMHIGGVRTAIFAWLLARKNKGTFILRIEDTDKDREVAGSIEHIQESLRWLGIDWDYGPDKPGDFGSCIQSKRLETYKKAAQILIDKGLAYPDPYSAEELENFHKKAEAEKRPFLYRDHRPNKFEVWDGTKPLRLKTPEIKRYKWHDLVRGDLEAGPEALDDFILIKSDGYPTYNFAHIVDDEAMGVTHVLRGEEFISSTPKFLSLYDALGWRVPAFATLPSILRDDRTKKLGKRDGAKDVLEYQREGYLAEAFFNYLVLIGWNPGDDREVMSREEIIQAFDIGKVQKAGGAFDEEKLRWMNKQHMNRLSNEDFLAGCKKFVPNISENIFDRALPVIRDRIHVFGEVRYMFGREGELGFVTEMPSFDPAKLSWKGESLADTSLHIKKILELLEPIAPADFSADQIKAAIWPYAEVTGKGNVLWPMRFALTGRDKSPDPFICANILGKEETLKRLRDAVALL
ncbi:MAG: glutamate--tRNA ligase [Patescibacteria group bacterium]|nr:glutamate--tRNA ligase [Patescibacteria group bacterium]